MRNVRSMSAPKGAQARPRLWILPLTGAAGALVAWIVVIALSPEPARTVSEVRTEIGELVLRKSERPNASDGGAIGPWWVSAADGDIALGTFSDFQLRSGAMQVAAKSARLVIDADLGTFRFELREVVVVRMPEDGGEDAGVVHLDRHTLGPIPLRGRVVYDSLNAVTPLPAGGSRVHVEDGFPPSRE